MAAGATHVLCIYYAESVSPISFAGFETKLGSVAAAAWHDGPGRERASHCLELGGQHAS